MRILLCAALIITDAVSISGTVIEAFLETYTNADDGAADVVHAFGPAERRAVNIKAVVEAVCTTYACADRATVTCAISTSISDAFGAADARAVARAFHEPDAAAHVRAFIKANGDAVDGRALAAAHAGAVAGSFAVAFIDADVARALVGTHGRAFAAAHDAGADGRAGPPDGGARPAAVS